MDSLRLKALEQASNRERLTSEPPSNRISDYYGADVFSRSQMRQYLSKDVYESVLEAIEDGKRIDRRIAAQVAEGMKIWAIERGATHYTHWFQPLNDSTAEKHDAFIEPVLGGTSFETFNANLLVQQEPDASSFPSGGLRNNFEARGYSAWDPSSPAFIMDKTLCIPSIFIAYTGEALDFKTPLIKSMAAIDQAAVEVCQLFDKDVTRVVPTLGWEQEYFLVDKALFDARPDLVQTGRTLMGHTAAKDQQLDDHYWGTIPQRVSDFMKEFEELSYRLGIPVKTRHNEVAPNQFECAPMYEEANVAVDHNVLLMSVMRKVATRHNLKVLFHEKPFAGVNGSGKHCNWSLATDTGVNLLSPGRSPKSNMQFLSFFVCVLKAVHDYGSLIMASIATETNSHRLGGSEAPPTILSVFTGSTMTRILDNIEQRLAQGLTPDKKSQIKLDIGKIPEILLDNTDRNRTSPFAFTGNRFEFRATGSSSNCAMPLIAIHAAVTHSLREFKVEVDRLMESGVKKDEAILKVIRKFIIASKNIRFEGNGYSPEWQAEAQKRGLKSVGNVSEALKEYLTAESVELFESCGVLGRVELEARYEIKNEIFLKKIQIESRVIVDMALGLIVPTAIRYQNLLIDNIRGIKEIFPQSHKELVGYEIKSLERIAKLASLISDRANEMTAIRRSINRNSDVAVRAARYEQDIRPMMTELRGYIDELEMLVDDRYWPLPKYRELLAGL